MNFKMTTDDLIQKELEEFKKEFCYIEDGAYELNWDLGIKPNGKDRLPELINFFRNSLHKIKEEAYIEAQKDLLKDYKKDIDEAKREAIEKVRTIIEESMIRKNDKNTPIYEVEIDNYNMALTDLDNSLKEDGGKR